MKIISTIALTLILATATATAVTANSVNPMELYDAKKYEQAYSGFLEENSTRKFFYLGLMNFIGTGTERNPDQALSYWQKGFENKDVRSSISLALTYISKKNPTGIDILENISSTTNNPTPMFELAKVYSDSNGLEFDLAKSFNWFKKAADLGHKESQSNVGLMYYYGDGVAKDMAKATTYYTISAENGFSNSQYALGVIYMEKSPEIAEEWLLKAAESGHIESILTLGDYYQIQKNDAEKSILWFEKAVELGSKEAAIPLAILQMSSDSENDIKKGLASISRCFIQDTNPECLSILAGYQLHKKFLKMINSPEYKDMLID